MNEDNLSARPAPYPRDKKGKFKRDKSRVICTHLYYQGKFSKELWLIDCLHSEKHLSQAVIRGYHFWAIPYVRLMRKHQWAEKLILPIVIYRAKEVACIMGKTNTPCILGKVVRLIGEPICWLIGSLVNDQNYEALYDKGQ